ncbi:MAG: hypothetical protein ABJA76_00460 [Mucilaginibacter sp.]
MKFNYPKLLFKSFVLLMLAGIIAGCGKEPFQPKTGNINLTDTTGGGSDTSGSGGIILLPDTVPSFFSPAGVAVDGSGNIYVADYGNNLIRKITASGVVSTLAGSGNQGSINAGGVLASFNQPTGIAVDAGGNVFVGDAGNEIIRKITPDGSTTTFAGSDSTGTTDGPAATASFFHPEGITLDAAGNIYVADAGNNLIRKVSGGNVSTIAGNKFGATPDNTFSNPTGVAIDAGGNIYTANFLANNILKINSAGAVSVFAGSGNIGPANGVGTAASFYFPNSIAVDAAGNLFVSDGVNDLIRKITPDGTVSTLAGSGVAGAADGTGTAASFNGPAGLAVDAAGNVYVADANNNRIRKITPAGVVTTVAGSGHAGSRNGQISVVRNAKTTKSVVKQRLPVFYKSSK